MTDNKKMELEMLLLRAFTAGFTAGENAESVPGGKLRGLELKSDYELWRNALGFKTDKFVSELVGDEAA
jgi:hypothetical protein